MVRRSRTSSGITKREFNELRKKVNELEKIIKEIQVEFAEYMSEPYRAFLDFFGVAPNERVFEKDGTGVMYHEILSKIKGDKHGKENTGDEGQ